MKNIENTTENDLVIEHIANLIKGKSNSKRDTLIVAIDGCGGSGKGTISKKLANLVSGLKILSTDYLYNFEERDKLHYLDYYDWNQLKYYILEPIREGQPITIPIYDLFPPRLKIADDIVNPGDIVLVEGFGSINKHVLENYDIKIHIDLNTSIAVNRALKRDIEESAGRPHRIESVTNFWNFWKPIIESRYREENVAGISDIVISTEDGYKIIKDYLE